MMMVWPGIIGSRPVPVLEHNRKGLEQTVSTCKKLRMQLFKPGLEPSHRRLPNKHSIILAFEDLLQVTCDNIVTNTIKTFLFDELNAGG